MARGTGSTDGGAQVLASGCPDPIAAVVIHSWTAPLFDAGEWSGQPLYHLFGEPLYHVTDAENLASIAVSGLKPDENPNGGYTDVGAGDWADDVYGSHPIFLARTPWFPGRRFPDPATTITLAVDVRGDLLPDLNSLIDEGFRRDGFDQCLYHNEMFEGLERFWCEEDGQEYTCIPYEALLEDEDVIDALIDLTGTCACLDAVGVHQLRLCIAASP